MTTPIVKIRRLGISFVAENGELDVLQDISLDIQPQEFVCVLGPSGAGKSTLLRILSGLVRPTSGSVTFTSDTPPLVSMVFQDANLMPWRDVTENVALPLELNGVPHAEARERANEWIRLVGLEGFEHEWPRHLSGGMAQRVAIARGLIQNPDLLLLDEPFGALDALTRERMGAELLQLWQERRTTVLMVTHSISEALLLADRVIVLTARPGQVALDMRVDLPRPRTGEIRYAPEFSELSRKLRSAIG